MGVYVLFVYIPGSRFCHFDVRYHSFSPARDVELPVR